MVTTTDPYTKSTTVGEATLSQRDVDGTWYACVPSHGRRITGRHAERSAIRTPKSARTTPAAALAAIPTTERETTMDLRCPECGETDFKVHEELRQWAVWSTKTAVDGEIALDLQLSYRSMPDDGAEFTGKYTLWCTACDCEFGVPDGWTVVDD